MIRLLLIVGFTILVMFGIVNTIPAQKKDPRFVKTVESISDKYKKDPKMVEYIVDTAVMASEDKGIDPVLTLAIIATESKFDPKAYNPSTASGLMQVLSGLHAKLIKSFGGSIFDPYVNIQVGTELLQTYLGWFKGNTKKALNSYGGDSTGGYYNSVMTNYKWIEKTMEQDL